MCVIDSVDNTKLFSKTDTRERGVTGMSFTYFSLRFFTAQATQRPERMVRRRHHLTGRLRSHFKDLATGREE